MAFLAGACAFLVRFVTNSGQFPNDHYVSLSRAQAMLAGDLPLQDYMEEGAPLTVAISAGAQLLLGEGPFTELMVVLMSLSAAAAVTCHAAGRLTGSPTLGFAAALLQIAVYPRTYSHPKLLLYPLLFLAGWAYLRRPITLRLAGLGALTAVAFLLRHDHGVYCAIGSGVTVALAHGREGAGVLMRRWATLACVTLVLVGPYLAYVQYHRGLVSYLQVGLAISRTEADRADARWPEIQPIRAGVLVTVEPRQRGAPAPTEGSWVRRIIGTLGLDRLRPGPPLQDLFSESNVVALLFRTLWLLPVAALVAWVLLRRLRPASINCGPEVVLLIAVAAVTTVAFAREPNSNRVADGFGTAPILGVWLLASLFRAPYPSAFLRGAIKSAVSLIAAIAVTATVVMAETVDRLRSARLLGSPVQTVARVRDMVRDMRTWPWRGAWPQGRGILLVPYLNRCTEEADRLLVLWNAPEFNVFSRRPFAGGETLLVPVFRPPDTYEQAVLRRLERQRVPIVLSDVDQIREFDQAYPHIAEYLSKRYLLAGVITVGEQRIGVSVDRVLTPTGVDPEFGLPCFSNRRSSYAPARSPGRGPQ